MFSLLNDLLTVIVDWSTCFCWMPTETVNQLAFGRQTISESMMFNQDGSFRFIKFAQEDKFDSSASENFKETQLLFQVAMARLFAEKLAGEPSFIFKFVSLCTGSAFVPDKELHPDYWITVEFNSSEVSSEFLPVLHTCDNLIKIPASAYDANMENFQAKLAITMTHSEGRFDME
jgi:hypothetical protein